MVMDGERTEIWEEEMEVGTSSSGSEDGNGSGRGGVLIRDLVGIIESVAQLGDFRRTQRKECLALVRRLKLLLPVLEELRDTPPLLFLPRKPLHALFLLKNALLLATKLLTTCNAGSKIYLALESEGFMIKFHVVNDKIHQALNNIMSCHELGMSDEVKEHVELLQTQLTRAKRRTDTQDIEFAVDMMVVCSKTDERNADSAIIERLAKKLELHTEEDVKTETLAVKHLVEQKGGVETLHQVVELLNKFKRILGMEETDLLLVANPAGPPKMLDKPSSLVIPNEFLCPITQEIMMDPVIVATGQSYERESIQKWFDSNHRTCPKTRQTLSDLSLAPNYALKTLILQWCEKHDLKVPRKEAAEESSTSDEEIHSLIKHLCSSQLDVQRRAAKGIRLLSKENPTNRVLFARYGAIPVLVQVLPYPDTKIQEHAVTALLNLSIDESNKKLIADAGAVPAIIEVLKNASVEARENSAAALFSLSMLDENKVAVGSWNGIPPLVELLRNGTIRGKRDAASALFNLSLNHHNKGKAIEAGIAVPLMRLVEDRKLGMVDEALSIFLLLATHVEGRQAIGQLSFIQVLVDLIREGTAKNRECAVSVLLELGSNNSAHILAALQFGVYEHLVEVSTSGTNRGQRKANALLQLITQSEQI